MRQAGLEPRRLRDNRRIRHYAPQQVDCPEAAILLVRHRRHQQIAPQPDAALPHLDALLDANPDDAHLRFRRAVAHAELGHWDMAAADHRRFIELFIQRGIPDLATPWFTRAPG